MTETIFDAMKRSRNPFAVAAMKAIATSDELFSVLPFVGKDGEGFDYVREKSLGAFTFVSDTHTTVAQSTGTDEDVTVPKREAVEDFYIRNFAQENLAGLISPADAQTIKKFKAAGRSLASKVINGAYVTGFAMSDNFNGGALVSALVSCSAFTDSGRYGPGSLRYTNAGTLLQYRAPGDRAYGPGVDISGGNGDYTMVSDNPSKWVRLTLVPSQASANAVREITFTSSTSEFDGLKKLISIGQTRSATGANGDAPSFGILDELLDAVKFRGNLAYVSNATIRRKYESLLRAMGGSNPLTLPDTSIQVPTYKGIPMLTNDNIASDESKGSATNLSSLYLVKLDPDEGFFMGALGGAAFDVTADPRNARVLGFRLYDLGQIQGGPSSFGRRLSWMGAAALKSDLAAARASQLTTV